MIVVTGEYGQLGNRLIVFANLIAAAQEHGLRVANPAFHAYAELFEGTRGDPLCRYPRVRSWLPAGRRTREAMHAALDTARRYIRRLRRRTGVLPPFLRTLEIGWERRCDLDGPEFLEPARRAGLLLVRGWRFRAERSFERHAEAIRTFFAPAEPQRARIAAGVRELRRGVDLLVGVHIRQGDYRTFLGGRFYHPTRHYAALLRGLRREFEGRRVRFVPCSNEPQDATAFDGVDVACGPGDVLGDLYTLAACDYLVAPPSTYSMWASFYGETPLYTLLDPQRTPTRADFAVVRNFVRSGEDHMRQPAPAVAAAQCR
ncbi:MAG: hypothetical protein AB1716_18795 [Planctomycetota bacterium]